MQYNFARVGNLGIETANMATQGVVTRGEPWTIIVSFCEHGTAHSFGRVSLSLVEYIPARPLSLLIVYLGDV